MTLLKQIDNIINSLEKNYFSDGFYMGKFSNVYEYHEYIVKQDLLSIGGILGSIPGSLVDKLNFYSNIDIYEVFSFDHMMSMLLKKDTNYYVAIKSKEENHLLKINPEIAGHLGHNDLSEIQKIFKNSLPSDVEVHVQ